MVKATTKKVSKKKTATKTTRVTKKKTTAAKTALSKHDQIALSAYLKAEKRGFIGGCQNQDWFEAESELA